MNVRHVLGISGGKDSAALAIYLRTNYPELDIEYYFCDTDKELPETYTYIEKLENYLGKPIKRIPDQKADIDLFDYFLKVYGGYLPSHRSRWCTVEMKLRPFEQYVANDLVVSYVGIRGDEERGAYISKKPNIQSIMPFRKNIWSEDVILKALANSNIDALVEIFKLIAGNNINNDFIQTLRRDMSPDFNIYQKVNTLLDIDAKVFNKLIFNYLKNTDYPLAQEDNYLLIENRDILGLKEIIKILEESIGMPPYYKKIDYEVEGKKGTIHRSRSGCYFCFFQQKIEWIWLYEQHPDLFEKAVAYEKEGYTWMQDERLTDLIEPERMRDIKLKNIDRIEKESSKSSNYLIDSLELDEEEEGCLICSL